MGRARLEQDGSVILIEPDGRERPLVARADWSEVDAMGEEELERHARVDDLDAAREAGAAVRGIRERAGLSEASFAARIGVSIATLKDWEAGRRAPRGPARALLRIIDRAPRTALRVLDQVPPAPSRAS